MVKKLSPAPPPPKGNNRKSTTVPQDKQNKIEVGGMKYKPTKRGR